MLYQWKCESARGRNQNTDLLLCQTLRKTSCSMESAFSTETCFCASSRHKFSCVKRHCCNTRSAGTSTWALDLALAKHTRLPAAQEPSQSPKHSRGYSLETNLLPRLYILENTSVPYTHDAETLDRAIEMRLSLERCTQPVPERSNAARNRKERRAANFHCFGF